MAEFTGNYQNMYEAGKARLAASVARKKAMLTNAAAARGINTSGVSLIPGQGVDREALLVESELGANIAQQQEQERLADKRFAQEKELTGMSLAEAAAERRRQRRDAAAGNTGQLIGTGLTVAATLL